MEYIKVLLPTICIGLLFIYVLRSVMHSDTIERTEMEKYAREARTDDPPRDGAAPCTEEEAASRTASDDPNERDRHGTRDEGGPH